MRTAPADARDAFESRHAPVTLFYIVVFACWNIYCVVLIRPQRGKHRTWDLDESLESIPRCSLYLRQLSS